VVANPSTGAKTVVAGLDDTTPGQVYAWADGDRPVRPAAVLDE
jgi:hypothetical protein